MSEFQKYTDEEGNPLTIKNVRMVNGEPDFYETIHGGIYWPTDEQGVLTTENPDAAPEVEEEPVIEDVPVIEELPAAVSAALEAVLPADPEPLPPVVVEPTPEVEAPPAA